MKSRRLRSANSTRKFCVSELDRWIDHDVRVVGLARREVQDLVVVTPERRIFLDPAPRLIAVVALVVQEVGSDIQLTRTLKEVHPLSALHVRRIGSGVARWIHADNPRPAVFSA